VKRALAIVLASFAACAIAACAQLLGIRQGVPAGGGGFPHRAHVLEGIACIDCHAGMEDAGERGPLHFPSDASCVECHEDPHDPSPCMRCHTEPAGVRRASGHRRHIRFQHATHLERRDGECVDCHGGVATAGGSLEARMGMCVSCHQHEEEIALRQCDSCHEDLVAEGAPPETHFVHDEAFMTSHGAQAASAADLCTTCHTESSCASCHGRTVAALPSRMAFDDPFGPRMHRAGFASRHAEEAAAAAGVCSTCHSENFCKSCHVREEVAAGPTRTASPHPPGWLGVGSNTHGAAARRDPMSCASCHSGAGEQLCIDCHRVGGIGGNPHPPGWHSDRNLLERPCRSCHIDP